MEGSHSPNEQDPRYNERFRAKYYRKIFSEAKASWVYRDLGQNIIEKFSLRQRPVEFTPDLPEKDDQISPYAHSYLQNCIKLEKKISFPSSFLIHINIFSFFSFLCNPFHLSLPGYSKMPYFQGFNDKLVGKQISKTNCWCVNASCKSNWILISSLQGQMCHWWRGPPKFPPTRWHIIGSWQLFLSSVYFVYEILHPLDGTPRGLGSLLKMPICHVSRWHRYAILSGES